MKKILFVAAWFCSVITNAQNYLITFSGIGASTAVSTVKVENITKGTYLTLNGTDILRLTTTTSVNSIEDSHNSGLNIYPNPMIENATLKIFPPVEGNANISICDINGIPLVQKQCYFENYRQDFLLSGMRRGIYIINVKGNSYQFSGKLINIGDSGGRIKIEELNSIVQNVDEKKELTDSKGTPATVDMAYSTGDRLLITGTSGNYSTVLTEIITGSKSITFDFAACTDDGGNNYPVVKIGTQTWMARNMAYLPVVSPSSEGSESAKYYYVYDYQGTNISNAKATVNYQTYGVLYNWPAAMNGSASSSSNPSGVRGVCPTGWHLPSHAEWALMVNYLTNNGFGYQGSGDDIAKSLSANTAWEPFDELGTPGNDLKTNNSSGFSGLPSGRRQTDGTFEGLEYYAPWWTTEGNGSSSGIWRLVEYADVLYKAANPASEGHAVRCIKDN